MDVGKKSLQRYEIFLGLAVLCVNESTRHLVLAESAEKSRIFLFDFRRDSEDFLIDFLIVVEQLLLQVVYLVTDTEHFRK